MPRKIKTPRNTLHIFDRAKTGMRNLYGRTVSVFKQRPLISFFSTLLILLIFIIIANILGTPRNQNLNQQVPEKTISVYHIGAAPKVSLPAKIEKSGVIKIVAQTPGIVEKISVNEGDKVFHGTELVSLASNYLGADAAGIQAQIAQAQYNNTKDTYGIQKGLIDNQRQVAIKQRENTQALRQIALQSESDTQSVIDFNNSIIASLDQTINTLSGTDTSSNSALILQTRQLKYQFQSGLIQLQNSLRQSQYQTNTNNPPEQLADLQKDITLKQLDIQQKALDLGKEVSLLQINLAYLNESLMHPASPVTAVVQRVHVTAGQAVTPGTLLVTLSAVNDTETTAVVSVPNHIASSVSQVEPSILHIGSKTFSAVPRFISREATDGNFYTVLYSIPPDYQSVVSNAGYISVDIPVALPDTGSTIPFIPLDSVYQTQDTAYVYVARNGKVESKQVKLGTVYGRFVEINSGLISGDQVILERNVVEEDRVKIQ